jgi:hypothetical protein
MDVQKKIYTSKVVNYLMETKFVYWILEMLEYQYKLNSKDFCKDGEEFDLEMALSFAEEMVLSGFAVIYFEESHLQVPILFDKKGLFNWVYKIVDKNWDYVLEYDEDTFCSKYEDELAKYRENNNQSTI